MAANGNFDINAALAAIRAHPELSGWGGPTAIGSGIDAMYYDSMPFANSGSYFNQGYAITPNKDDGTWLVYKPEEGGHASRLNGTFADKYSADGKYLGKEELKGITDMNPTKQALIAGTIMLGGIGATVAGAGAAAAGGGAAGGTGGGAGAVGSGGGFVGEGALSGVGAWDGALAAAPSWSAPAAAGSGAFLGENMASGVPGWDAAATNAGLSLETPAAALSGGGAALEGVPPPQLGPEGVPPPANPNSLSFSDVAGNVAKSLTGGSGGFSWESLIGPAIQLVGGAIAGKAAGKAADSQEQAAREALALQERMFNKSLELQEPFRQNGLAAGNRMTQLLGIGGDPTAPDYNMMNRQFTADDLYKDPSYEFRKSEGMKGVTNAYAGKGNFFSGAAMKGIDRFNSDYASTEYGNAWNRNEANKTNTFNRLASVYGSGQTAANTQGAAGQNYANAGGQYISNAGDARAAGTIGAANAMNDALNNGWRVYQSGQNRDYENRLMERLLQPRGY